MLSCRKQRTSILCRLQLFIAYLTLQDFNNTAIFSALQIRLQYSLLLEINLYEYV